ncbi:bile acid:sodium symporter family protein [Bacillaceae bacterium Marseille-Q3522]|nr:bile acid:sodium symporter family protein [Bacillaceae bacterium Marseille-Q3522]
MNFLENLSKKAGDTFAIWVILFAIISLIFPGGFTWISDYVPYLLGIIMFGMGMTLSINDFKSVLKQPKSVIIGILAQFIIMPGLAFLLAKGLRLSDDVAVGVILVGCCPGGTASNVMTYLAKGNTALSVAITSCTTLLAPIVTPALIFLLASEWLPVSAGALFTSILQIVIVPIVLGIVIKLLLKEKVDQGVKALPLVSVIGIVAILTAVVSNSRGNILESGLFIFLVVILHNGLGLLIGFFAAKFLKLSYPDQKAVSIEVGMQNSGLGAALALAHFNPLAAVPSAIFSFWHNVSGPLLATYWAKKAEKVEKSKKDD